MDLKEGDLEFCFGPEKGVLGIDALPHPNPKVHTTFAVFAQFLGFTLRRVPKIGDSHIL